MTKEKEALIREFWIFVKAWLSMQNQFSEIWWETGIDFFCMIANKWEKIDSNGIMREMILSLENDMETLSKENGDTASYFQELLNPFNRFYKCLCQLYDGTLQKVQIGDTCWAKRMEEKLMKLSLEKV